MTASVYSIHPIWRGNFVWRILCAKVCFLHRHPFEDEHFGRQDFFFQRVHRYIFLSSNRCCVGGSPYFYQGFCVYMPPVTYFRLLFLLISDHLYLPRLYSSVYIPVSPF